MDTISFSPCIQIVYLSICPARITNASGPNGPANANHLWLHRDACATAIAVAAANMLWVASTVHPKKWICAVCFAFRPEYGAAYQITKIRLRSVLCDGQCRMPCTHGMECIVNVKDLFRSSWVEFCMHNAWAHTSASPAQRLAFGNYLSAQF